MNNRKQYVQYNDNQSDHETILYGVPQGTILGPLLFILYINDIVKASKILNFTLYADDSVLYASHTNLHTLIDIVNHELVNIKNWISSYKITLNASFPTTALVE